MTREIKFRAWDKKTNSMIKEVFEIGLGDRHNPETWLVGDDRQTNNFDLMQYTGLKDKNGKEIYEGDILFFKYYDAKYDDLDQGNAVVKFGKTIMDHNYTYGYCLDLSDCKQKKPRPSGFHRGLDHGNLEILGNIYENPELLKE